MSKLRKYLEENRGDNDPTEVYDDLGELAENIREYYFTAMDNLDRLKLGYGESSEDLQGYVDKIKENADKIKEAYENIENFNKKGWTRVNVPGK